jgi:hypothetical protein
MLSTTMMQEASQCTVSSRRNSTLSESLQLTSILRVSQVLSKLFMLEYTADCDGTNSVIRTNRQCSIPLTTLRGTAYDLLSNQAIVVRVTAKNLIGFGDVTPTSSTSVTLYTEPQAP